MSSSEYNWISNSFICNTMYKCKKTTISAYYISNKCKWQGTLAEYSQHVKNKHSKSFFTLTSLNKPQKFEWKLPFIGDQTDLGIFHHNNLGRFLYEIYFKQNSGEIYFSLAYLGQLQDNFEGSYKILLINKSGAKETLTGKVNVESEDMLKPINEQKHKIIIENDVVLKHLYPRRVLQWYLEIIIATTVVVKETTETAPPKSSSLLLD